MFREQESTSSSLCYISDFVFSFILSFLLREPCIIVLVPLILVRGLLDTVLRDSAYMNVIAFIELL